MGTCKTAGCNKPTTEERHQFCPDCNRKKNQARSSVGVSGGENKVTATPPPPPDFPENYLKDGYFYTNDDKNYIREEVFISWAQHVSKTLSNRGMTAAAIRRFYNKVKAIEYRFKYQKDFCSVKEKLDAFLRDVAYSQKRNVTKQIFTTFIEKNVVWAKKDSDHFLAFVEHYQSVIAYFKDTRGESA